MLLIWIAEIVVNMLLGGLIRWLYTKLVTGSNSFNPYTCTMIQGFVEHPWFISTESVKDFINNTQTEHYKAQKSH